MYVRYILIRGRQHNFIAFLVIRSDIQGVIFTNTSIVSTIDTLQQISMMWSLLISMMIIRRLPFSSMEPLQVSY